MTTEGSSWKEEAADRQNTTFRRHLSESGDAGAAWALALSDLIADGWEVGALAPWFVFEARKAAWYEAGRPDIEDSLAAWEKEHIATIRIDDAETVADEAQE